MELYVCTTLGHIISSLLAKKMGSTRVTARINNDEYLENDNKILFTEMGIDLLFYPEKIASHEIIDLLKQTGTSEFMDFSGGKLQLIAFRLDDGAPLIDKTIGELSSSNEEPLYRAVAVAREGQTIIPRRDTKFKEHDLVIGSGSILVIDERTSVIDFLRYTQDFFLHESCGQCTPCREGNRHIKMFLDKIKAQTHTQEDLETMQTFAKVMPMSSLCGLGETAQNALKSAMKIFPDTFKIKN